MKRLLFLPLAALPLFLMSCDQETPAEPEAQTTATTPLFGVGNLAPSGPHYNLNIIGVENGHENDNFNSQGRRIFVPLGRSGNSAHCDIALTEGDGFAVTDYNCLDDDGGAAFTLPDPDPYANDGYLVYSVWARALGKPGGHADMSACYDDAYGTWCWADELQLKLDAHGNNNKFYDASRELLTVCACKTYDAGVCVRWKEEALFSTAYDYFWHYENEGLRLAQLRFYPGHTYTANGDIATECRQVHGSDIY